jgi:branched-chain amino acid transport system permease protein
MRSAAENPLLAGQSGINVYFIFALAWSLSTLAAGLGGILYGASNYVAPDIGFIGIKAFPVALTGGLDSLLGLGPAAIIIAVLETVGFRYGGLFWGNVMPMIIMLLVLIVRPWGLRGTKEELERV